MLDMKNWVKIKEEPIDTTLNTEDATEDSTLIRNCFSLVDHNYHDYHYRDKSSLVKNDTVYEDINNTKNRHSKDDSVHLNDVNKTVERKRLRDEVPNTLQVKKRKCSNKVCSNKNTNTLHITTTKHVKDKIKQNIILECETKIQHRNKSKKKKKFVKCNVCFRKFSALRNYKFHKLYYEFSEKEFLKNEKLLSHMGHRKMKSTYQFDCNFCSRTFNDKLFLQSHLFHIHSNSMYFNNTIKDKTSKSENVNISTETLRTNVNEESCSKNFKKDNVKSEKINTTLIDNENKSWDDNIMNTEKSFNDEMPTKRLRQPTLMEYLELHKQKYDVKLSPNKLNTMKDFPACTSHDEQIEENLRPRLSEGHNSKIDVLPTTSDNLPKQMAHSTLEQTMVKHETYLPKKSFVRLHADVEIMKVFLEKLSNTSKDTEDQTSGSVSYDYEIPYSLRSLHGVHSVSYDYEIPYSLRSLHGVPPMEADPNSEMRKNRNVSREKKPRVDKEFDTEREQNVIDVDKVDPKVDWKIIMAHFKCKECTVPLTRCELLRNSPQISTIATMKNSSLTTQCNSTLFQESDVQNKMILKDLEVSLQRLTTNSTNSTVIKTETGDAEQHNNNNFLCKVCKKSFSSKLDKHIHIKSSHVAYMSSICNARYTLKHKLLQHYLCEHQFKQNQCGICHMLLPDYQMLTRHLNIHCLKYLQREDDQYPIDVDLKCNLTKRVILEDSFKCLHCNKTFSLQSSLETHQSCCVVQEEVEKDQKEDFVEKTSVDPKDILEIQYKQNTDENLMCDKRILDDLSKPLNSNCIEEKLNEHQISLYSEKVPEINEINRNCIEEKSNEHQLLFRCEKVPEINANRNPLVNNNLSEAKMNDNEPQNSEKLLENNSIISNQNIANTQLNDTTTKTVTYPCDICGKQFHTPKNLEGHIRIYSFATDICPMCGTGFSSKRLLQTHITAAHVPHISETYSFHCVFCNQGFIKKYDLRSHILHLHSQQMLNALTCNFNESQEKSDHSSIIHTAICNVCNLVFETHDRYVEHRMYYYKNHTFTCSLCTQNFQGMYMLHHHTKLVHYSEDKRKSYTYICNICNEGFNHESHFYSHSMHVHSNEIDLIETAKEFEKNNHSDSLNHSDSSNIQEKIRNFHTEQQKQNEQPSNEYTCEICQLKCTDENHMAKHREFYSNDGDFKCDKCNRQCKTVHLLECHKKLTHSLHNDYGKIQLCHICGEILETNIELKCHDKHFHSNTTDNNTMDNWKNDQILSSNISHKIIEHSYKSKNNICNVTEYNCLFCDKKFSTANTVQTHIVHVHMDEMIAKRAILKLTLPIINNNDQKQFVEIDLPSSSLSSTSSLSSLSEDNSIHLLQRSIIQQPNIQSNLRYNVMTKKEINDKSIELLKKFRTVYTKNDNIPTKSKADTPVSSPIESTTFKTVAANTKFGNNTSTVLSFTGPTISKTIISNTESKDNTSVPLSGLTNDLDKTNGSKKFAIVYPKNDKVPEKTPIPAILCINKSKDNSTSGTIPNTESKTDTSVSPSIVSTTVRTIAPSTKFGDNTSAVLSFTEPTIPKTIVSTTFTTVASNTKSKGNTSFPLPESTNDVRKNYGVSLQSESSNEFKANLSNRFIRNYSKGFITINKPKTASDPSGSLSTLKDMPQSSKSNEITGQKFKSVKSYCGNGYSCPLCPLEYPSLMFFHAHLKYAHADSIQTNELVTPQMFQAQNIFTIKCLLCSHSFMNETEYKKHLREFHVYYIHVPNCGKMIKNDDQVCNTAITKTYINKKSTVPETITINDDDNVKNTSDQQTTEVTDTIDLKRQNEKIGKLRVKPFAKIIENLSKNSALKYL